MDIIDEAAVNSIIELLCGSCLVFTWTSIFGSLGYTPRMALPGQMAVLCLNFEEPSDCFPKWLHRFMSLPAMREVPVSPHPHQQFVQCPFGFKHPSEFGVV